MNMRKILYFQFIQSNGQIASALLKIEIHLSLKI